MKTITDALAAHFQGNLTTLATCWRVTRPDGKVLGFTDHDVSLTIDGLKYVASSGYFRSAIANTATTSVDNLEVRGFLNSDFISEDELRNGAYDFAEVEIFAVNWADLSQGICRLRYGFFGEVVIRPSGLFVVELRGLMQLFSQTVGETLSPECRADLGDHRCRFPLLPPIRRSGQEYTAGDRVIIGATEKYASVSLPIKNKEFSWYESDEYYGIWESSNALFTNFPDKPKVGIYYVRPNAATGYIRRRIPVYPYPTINVGGVDIQTQRTINMGFHVMAKEPGWEVGALIEVIELTGFFGTGTEIHNTFEIGYREITTFNEWVPVFKEFEESLHPDVELFRITIRWRPSPINPPASSVCQLIFDDVSFANEQPTTEDSDLLVDVLPFEDEFMGFTLPNPEVAPVVGWSHGNSYPGNVNIMPRYGSNFYSHGWDRSYDPGQEVLLEGSGVDFTELDAGNYRAHLFFAIGSFQYGSTGGVALRFGDADGNTIVEERSESVDLKPYQQWLEREFEFNVPPGTREVDVIMFAGIAPERETEDILPSTVFDKIDVELRHVNAGTKDNIVEYGGVEYEALTDGVAGSTVPAVSRTIGDEFTDGGVIFRVVQPKYTFLAEVEAAESHTVFTLPTIDAPDNHFKWGVLTFLSGDNMGRGVEVLKWDNTTKQITLMLPALRPIEPGTLIRVHAGCDKTRGIGGCKKFNNILNFRGEPEVPGTDQYFKVGGAGG